MTVHYGEAALQTFDKVRKLLAKAASLGDTEEAKTFLAKADEMLRPYKLTRADMEAPPVFVVNKNFQRRPDAWAAMGKAQGWKHIDPSTESYSQPRDEDAE